MNEPYIWRDINARRGQREPFAGLDYQGRLKPRKADPQDDEPPRPRMTPTEGVIVCVLFGLSLALVASVVSVLWVRWFP